MPNYSAPHGVALDGAFHALASDVRRGVLTELGRGPAPVSELAAPFDMALPSFLRHIQLLERAGCVRTEKAGRVRTCHLVPEPFDLAGAWLAGQRAVWRGRTDRLEHFLLADDPADDA